MKELDLMSPTGAIFSDDRRYRYALWRVWKTGRPFLMVIGLNPSQANEFCDDPTITRGMVRADRTGFGGLLMGNLYGHVSTDPNQLIGRGDTVGEWTDFYLRQMIAIANVHLCGWGSFKPVGIRAPTVLSMITAPYCLGINVDGQPKHPLYVSYDTPMVKYTVRGAEESK